MAFFRLLKAFWLLITFRLDAAAKALRSSPEGVTATMEEVIRVKTGKITKFRTAVATQRKENEKKKGRKKALDEEVAKLKRVKEGAKNKAKKKIKELTGGGMSLEDAKKHPEVLECQKYFQDFSSTLTAKEETLATLTADIEAEERLIEDHLKKGRRLIQDLEKLKSEKGELVARLISADALREANEAMADIADDGSAAARLADVRDAVAQAEANAKVTADMTGLTAKNEMDEFEDYAAAGEAADEFFADMDLKDTTSTSVPAPDEKVDVAPPNGVSTKSAEHLPE